jgi:hypothetical protein
MGCDVVAGGSSCYVQSACSAVRARSNKHDDMLPLPLPLLLLLLLRHIFRLIPVPNQQAEAFEPEVEEEADDPQQQQQQLDRQTSPAAAAAAKPAVPVVIRPKGLIPGAKAMQGKPAAATAGSKPPPPAAAAADKDAASERAAALMKEFAQPAPAASGSKRLVKVGVVSGGVWCRVDT